MSDTASIKLDRPLSKILGRLSVTLVERPNGEIEAIPIWEVAPPRAPFRDAILVVGIDGLAPTHSIGVAVKDSTDDGSSVKDETEAQEEDDESSAHAELLRLSQRFPRGVMVVPDLVRRLLEEHRKALQWSAP